MKTRNLLISLIMIFLIPMISTAQSMTENQSSSPESEQQSTISSREGLNNLVKAILSEIKNDEIFEGWSVKLLLIDVIKTASAAIDDTAQEAVKAATIPLLKERDKYQKLSITSFIGGIIIGGAIVYLITK